MLLSGSSIGPGTSEVLVVRRRKLVCVSSAVLASVVLSIGATAWACTEFTSLVAPKSTPALAEIQVKGTGQVKPRDASKQVEIRWNDVTGPVVATATAQQISAGVKATVPNVPAGIYFLVAVNDGKGSARTSIEVTSPVGAAAPVDFRPLTPSVGNQPAAASSGNSSQLAGMGLLAGGLVVLFGGALAGLSLQSRKARALSGAAGHDDLSA